MNKKTEPTLPDRAVDQYFNKYEQIYQHTQNKWLVYVSILAMMFGVIAVVWAIPFPHLSFLGRYNGFVNWASFLIAAWIYYYLKMSPVASYLMLFVMFGFSYGIIQLEQWQKAGGLPLWTVGIIFLIAGLIFQILILRAIKVQNYFSLLLNAPLWLWVSLLKRFKVKY